MPRSDRGGRNSPSTAKQDGSRSKREGNNRGTENPQAIVNPLFGSTTVRLVALVSCVFYVACAKLKSHPVVLDFFRSLSRPASGVDYSFSAHIEWIGKVEDMQSRNEFGRIFEVPEGTEFEVLDLTKPSRATNGVSLSTSENGSKRTTYNIGKYDEDRSGMYETDLFQNSSYVIDGFTGKRVIHIGLDLGGPVGTPVYSFADGTVYKAGYNPSEGDYGNVVVTAHNIAGRDVYALYGHLDAGSVVDKKEGDNVKRGDLIGRLGAKNENGGWEPHVHFQISTLKPSTHDMPGVVSRESREKALVDYPDPRIVLGKLYKD